MRNNMTSKLMHLTKTVLIFAAMHVSANAFDGSVDAVLDVDVTAYSELHSSVFGFNTNLAPGHYGYLDPAFVRNIEKIRPAMLRFPGGTVANFYHWKEEGFRKQEMYSTTSKKINESNLEKYTSLKRSRNGKLSFNEFMRLCTQYEIEPVIVVNLYTGTPQESADWVSYAKTRGYKIKRWELGNEFYIRIYKNRFSGPEEYLRLARKHAIAMKNADPEIEIAVPVAGNGFVKYDGSKAKYRDHWNKVMASADFADAFAVHAYWKLPDTNDLNELHDYLFNEEEQAWSRALSYYEELYPNKPLWLTEWNIDGFKNRSMNNTHLDALFIADRFLHIVNSNIIEAAAYHQIAARGNWPSLFSKDRGNTSKQSDQTYVRTPFFPFLMLGDAIRNTERVYQSTIKYKEVSKRNMTGDEQNELYAVVMSRHDDRWVFAVVNKGKTKHNLVLRIDSKVVSGIKNFKCLMSENLRDVPYVTDSQNSKESKISHSTVSAVEGGEIELPGYSFCTFERPPDIRI